MLPRRAGLTRLIFLLWTTCFGALSCAAGQSASSLARQQGLRPLVLADLGRASIPVETWLFHPGDDMAWAAPGFDDSAWQRIEAGRSWEGQGHRGMTGFGWYRRRIELPGGASRDWVMALSLAGVDSACEVYWNGFKVGEVGRVPPHALWFINSGPRVIRMGRPESGELAVRVWRAPRFFLSSPEEGGLEATPRVGDSAALDGLQSVAQLNWLKSVQWQWAVDLLSGIVGVLAFLAWLRNRRRRMLLWLAVAMIFPVTIFLIETPAFVSFRLFYATIGPDVIVHDIALWFLLIALLGLEEHLRLVRWTKIWAVSAVALSLIDTALMLVEWTPARARVFLALDIASTIPVFLLEAWGILLVWQGLRRRQDGARWFLAVSALLVELLQMVTDSNLGSRWTHWNPNVGLDYPLLEIAGSPLTLATVLNLVLLVAILYAAWRFMEEAGSRQRALEQEYRSAQELQQVLVPEAMPVLAGCTVESAYRPAQEVGGDFFQVIPLEAGATVLVIGDVSGKGLHAAMTVALIVGAIRSTVETTGEPAAILTALNRRLHGRVRGGFATCLVARVDANGACTLANAGHLPPFLNGEELELTPALPLGIVEEAEYSATKRKLDAGDRLTLYTDGLLEARNTEGELFGFERVREWSARPAEEIATEAQRFGQDDDITVLTLEFAPVEVAHA